MIAPTATDELFVIPTNWSSSPSYGTPDPPNVATRFPDEPVIVIVTPQLGTWGNAVEHTSAIAGAAISISTVQHSTAKRAFMGIPSWGVLSNIRNSKRKLGYGLEV